MAARSTLMRTRDGGLTRKTDSLDAELNSLLGSSDTLRCFVRGLGAEKQGWDGDVFTVSTTVDRLEQNC